MSFEIKEVAGALTQKKVKKYKGYANLSLNDFAAELESFFMGQKFGWIQSANPQVFIETDKYGNVIIKCFTSKTMITTWGNSKETAINVILEKNEDVLTIHCGFTGNSSVLSAKSVFGMVLTGGASLVGNAASAIKDGKLVDSTFNHIDELLNNVYKDSAPSIQQIVIDNSNDIPAQIEKLASLKEKGILTEEEFTAKKKELLDKM